MTFSRTLSDRASPRFWKVRAMPSPAISCAPRASRSSASRWIAPASGPTSRLMQLNRVVLPAPLGPMRPQISPCATSKAGPSRATTPPNRTTTSFTDSTSFGPPPVLGFTPCGAYRTSVGREVGPPLAERAEGRPEGALGLLLVERLVDVGHHQRVDRGGERLHL